MSRYTTQAIRSVALVGHGAVGKTSLVEALLFATNTISSKGSIERGTTVCDFDAAEKEAGHSLTSALVNFAYEDNHIHLIFFQYLLGKFCCIDTSYTNRQHSGFFADTCRIVNIESPRYINWRNFIFCCR